MVAATFTPAGLLSRVPLAPLPLIVVAGLVVGYVLAVRRWDTTTSGGWPVWRSASWAGAMALLVVGLLSGLASFDANDFVIHAVIDALVGVTAPVLAAVGAPLTLVAGTSPRAARRVGRMVDHPVTRAVTHPLGAWIVFSLSIFVLYTGPVWRATRQHAVLLQLGHLELLVAGCIFVFPVIGSDLAGRRIRVGWTVGYLLAMVPLWTLFGMWVESATHALGPGAGVDTVNTAGGLLWTVGSLTGIATAVGVVYHWLFVDLARVEADEEVDVEALDMQAAVWRVSRILAKTDRERATERAKALRGATVAAGAHEDPAHPSV